MSNAERPNLQVISLSVEGMSCASCTARIARYLDRVDGVVSSGVNLAAACATVRFDPARTNPEALAGAIEAAGYQAHLPVSRFEAASGRAASVSDPIRHQIASLRSRLVLSAVLTVPLLVGMVRMAMAPGLPAFFSDPVFSLLAASAVQFWAGAGFYAGAARAARAHYADMDTLVVLGTSAAYFYSLAALVFGWLVPPAAGTPAPPLYFDTSAAIITLILLGRYLEARARVSAADAITGLLELAPTSACVLRDGIEAIVPAAQLKVGDLVRVRPGQIVPADGRITFGNSSIDQSLVTGESLPVERAIGDTVIGATLNLEGSFTFEVSGAGADSVLAQIVAAVQAASGSRAPIARTADAVVAVFVPAILAIAGLTFAAHLVLDPSGGPGGALTRAIAVLVVACPCALGLATPVAIMVGSGAGARAGLLFREAQALERLSRVDTIALDKTGTLTEGRMSLAAIVPLPPFEEEIVLRLVAGAELGSEHPIGRALVRAARERGLDLRAADDFAYSSGAGVSATVEGCSVRVGRANFAGVSDARARQAVERAGADGASVVFATIDGQSAAYITLSDRLRPEAAGAVAALAASGRRLVMLSGDNAPAAAAMAHRAGIAEVRAPLNPMGKAQVIAALVASGRQVAMVGDGVNDAPALAAAQVGVALGTGTNIASAAAGLTIMGSDLRSIGDAISLSAATMAVIRANLAWAFGYNLLLIPAAAGVAGIALDPIAAAAAMAASSLCVVLNALRLRRWRPAER